jgi:endonuclease G, mitochondrial
MKNNSYDLFLLQIHLFIPVFLLGIVNYSCSLAEQYEESVYSVPVEEINRTYTYAGNPESVTYPNDIKVLYNEGYISGYDEIRGNPAWVAYRVFAVDEYETHPRPGRFLIDDRTSNRISHDDYTNSGYDRGHMAPNFAIVTRFGQGAQRETFYMTNIIPQKPTLNRHWWQRLERLIAKDYSDKYDQVWALLGPVYKEEGHWINERVKIPSHNYLIIKVEKEGEFHMKAFLVHQDVSGSEPLEPYLISVRELEEKTGLNFNPLLEETIADSLEAIKLEELW